MREYVWWLLIWDLDSHIKKICKWINFWYFLVYIENGTICDNYGKLQSLLDVLYLGQILLQGLSGTFVDTACFHCFLYIFQTSFTYYNSVTQAWIKYKTGSVFCDICTQYLLLWQCRVEVAGARQKILFLIYQILFLSFNFIVSKCENVVKLNNDVR